MMRLIVSAAELVCSVARQRWPGLGDGERRLDRLQVAHLADQDHVRVLPERVLERLREALGVRPTSRWFTMHPWWRWTNSIGSSMVRMCPGAPVDLVEHRGQRGGLAGAGGPGDQHQPARAARPASEHRRAAELLERLDLEGDLPDGERHAAALPVGVAAEAREVLDAEGEVQLVLVLEALLLVLGEDRVGELERVLGGQDLLHALLVIAPSTRSFGRSPAVMCRSDGPLDHLVQQRAQVQAHARIAGDGVMVPGNAQSAVRAIAWGGENDGKPWSCGCRIMPRGTSAMCRGAAACRGAPDAKPSARRR
jgi:hypothetical protein